MKYLFTYDNRYYDINNEEVVVNNDLPRQLDLNGFDISSLESLDLKDIVGKRLVTSKVSSSSNLRLNIKNTSARYILLKLDKPFPNLRFPVPRKMIISTDGVKWKNYYDYDNYDEKEFYISLNTMDIDAMNQFTKSEFLKATEYVRLETKPLDVVNTENIKYMLIEITESINIICMRNELTDRSYLILNEDDVTVFGNKDNISIKNTSKFPISMLGVKVIKPSNVIINTLKEF
jgi:hypothetical protein